MHHNPSRMVRERRQNTSAASPSATAIVDSAPPSSSTSVVSLTAPTSTSVLAAIVAILFAVVLLGIAICIYRRQRKSRKSAEGGPQPHVISFEEKKKEASFDEDKKHDLHISAYGIEKPSRAFIPDSANTGAGWVPQIPSADATHNSAKKSKSKKTLRPWDKTLSGFAPSERSPPPSYPSANASPTFLSTQIPLPPSPPHQSAMPPTPPTPPAKKSKTNPFAREIPPAKPEPSDLAPLPLPSPARTASFAHMQTMQMPPEDEAAIPPSPLPVRLMNVVSAFAPTMEDELALRVGETVRVLEEFQDGWGLVQRVGRNASEAPKGVVPMTCLVERVATVVGRRL
ncbi:unnamed protein product [Mycena citricolor]|uniref:SH3 domain-containing protein n=1 Tax=Mycena citricolor TaxID=2018698 RepID=A0AAD2HLV1_9AGAR|nr:unnamed protein product [Mycena citricolor]